MRRRDATTFFDLDTHVIVRLSNDETGDRWSTTFDQAKKNDGEQFKTKFKARTAAIFRRPSREFEDQVKNGRIAALALPGATPLQGGLPIVYEGKVIGAVGVSGNTPQEDEDIARAGVAAFE